MKTYSETEHGGCSIYFGNSGFLLLPKTHLWSLLQVHVCENVSEIIAFKDNSNIY